MKRRRLRCPACKSTIEVTAAPDASTFECPECGKRLRIGSRSAPPVPEQSNEEQPSQEDAWDDNGADAWNDSEQEPWSYQEDEQQAQPLPPRKQSKAKKSAEAKTSNTQTPAIISATSGRYLDDLADGKNAKRHYFSEDGSRWIYGLVVGVVVLLLFTVTFGYLRAQFRSQGLLTDEDSDNVGAKKTDALLDTYDYYAGNTEKPVTPKASLSDKELAKAIMASARIIPVNSESSASTGHQSISWTPQSDKQNPRWNLENDPGASFAEIAALSEKYSLSPIQFTGKLAAVYGPGGFRDKVLINLESRQGRRVQGDLQPRSITDTRSGNARDFQCSLESESPNGALMAFMMSNRDDEGTQRFITIHEYDNTLVKVLKDATAAAFVSEQRLLISTRDPADESRADRSYGQTLSFWNHADAAPEGAISVAIGGHWVLSPACRYLVVIEPDAATSAKLKQNPQQPFDFQCEKISVRIYETVTGQLLTSSEFNEQTVGDRATISHDGTRLALFGSGRFLIVNLTDGTLFAKGALAGTALEKASANQNPFRWLTGTDFLQIGSVIVSLKDGIVIAGDDSSRNNKIRVPNIVLADRYARDSLKGAYTELSTAAFERLREMRSVAPDALPTEPVSVSLTLSGTESSFVQELLRTWLPQRLEIRVADDVPADAWRVTVLYSEIPGGGSHNLDKWRSNDPWARKQQQKRQEHLPTQQAEIGVELKLICTDSTGRTICEDTVRGINTPSELDFELPIEMQFRSASLAAAISKLKQLGPTVESENAESIPGDLLWSGEVASECRNPLDGDFAIEDVPVDNAWIDEDHGLPILK